MSITLGSYVGQWGYYYSPRGSDSAKNGKPCEVISNIDGELHIRFKDKRFCSDAVHLGIFIPNPNAKDA